MSLNGIDISYSQYDIDAGAVPADFVIIKATQGTWLTISCCDSQYQAAKASGKLVGVYHYAEGGNVQAEADYFLSQIAGYIGEAMLVLDWERYDNSDFNNSAWPTAWCDYVYSKTGVKPVIYMSGSVASDYDFSAAAAHDYGLWEAYYTQGTTGYVQGAPTWGGEFTTPMMLQYTSSGRLANYGGNLDLNEFYGDRAAWLAYAGAADGGEVKPVEPAKDPAELCPQVDGGNSLIKNGQLHSANFTGVTLTADGVVGPETNHAKVRVLQRAMNADYGAGLAEDGEAGSATYNALRGHYVQKSETQFMVTALEILLLLHGYDPQGVECPGVFGSGLEAAVRQFQADNCLEVDGIAGYNTFAALIC